MVGPTKGSVLGRSPGAAVHIRPLRLGSQAQLRLSGWSWCDYLFEFIQKERTFAVPISAFGVGCAQPGGKKIMQTRKTHRFDRTVYLRNVSKSPAWAVLYLAV